VRIEESVKSNVALTFNWLAWPLYLAFPSHKASL